MPSTRLHKLKFDEIGSTHTYAIENHEEFLGFLTSQCDAVVISCKRQVQGIGAYDLSEVPKRRQWIDGKNGGGNIKCSILLKVPIRIALSPSTVNSLAVVKICKILESYQFPSSSSVEFKWPNDIMVNNRKAGGMLSQLPPLKSGKLAAFNQLNLLSEIDLTEIGQFCRLDTDEAQALPFIATQNIGDGNTCGWGKYNGWSIPMILSFGLNLNPVELDNTGYVLDGFDEQRRDALSPMIETSLPEALVDSFLELLNDEKKQTQFINDCQSWLDIHTFGKNQTIDLINSRGQTVDSSVKYHGIDIITGRIIYEKGDGVWTRGARQISFV